MLYDFADRELDRFVKMFKEGTLEGCHSFLERSMITIQCTDYDYKEVARNLFNEMHNYIEKEAENELELFDIRIFETCVSVEYTSDLLKLLMEADGYEY